MAGMDIATLSVSIEADNTGAVSSIQELIGKIEQVIDRMGEQKAQSEETSDALDEGAKGNVKSFVDVAAACDTISNALSKVANAAKKFLGESIEAANALTQEVGRTNFVFGESSQKVTDWSKTTVDKIGMADSAALAAANNFGQMAIGMDISSQKSAEMSMNLVELAADLASANMVASPEEGLGMLEGIFTGSTKGLKKLVGTIDDEALEAFAQEKLGLDITFSALGANEQAMLRYQYVMDKLSGVSGDFAANTNLVGQSQAKLEAATLELKEAFGAELEGQFAGILNLLTGVVKAIGELPDGVKKAIGITGEVLVATAAITAAIVGIKKALDALMANPWALAIGAIVAGISAIAIAVAEDTADAMAREEAAVRKAKDDFDNWAEEVTRKARETDMVVEVGIEEKGLTEEQRKKLKEDCAELLGYSGEYKTVFEFAEAQTGQTLSNYIKLWNTLIDKPEEYADALSKWADSITSPLQEAAIELAIFQQGVINATYEIGSPEWVNATTVVATNLQGTVNGIKDTNAQLNELITESDDFVSSWVNVNQNELVVNATTENAATVFGTATGAYEAYLESVENGEPFEIQQAYLAQVGIALENEQKAYEEAAATAKETAEQEIAAAEEAKASLIAGADAQLAKNKEVRDAWQELYLAGSRYHEDTAQMLEYIRTTAPDVYNTLVESAGGAEELAGMSFEEIRTKLAEADAAVANFDQNLAESIAAEDEKIKQATQDWVDTMTALNETYYNTTKAKAVTTLQEIGTEEEQAQATSYANAEQSMDEVQELLDSGTDGWKTVLDTYFSSEADQAYNGGYNVGAKYVEGINAGMQANSIQFPTVTGAGSGSNTNGNIRGAANGGNTTNNNNNTQVNIYAPSSTAHEIQAATERGVNKALKGIT